MTNYFCKTFRLPSDGDYHVVASDPLLDNTKVIHHMILYGCSKDVKIEKDPFNCIMGQTDCQDMILGWTVGEEGMIRETIACNVLFSGLLQPSILISFVKTSNIF